MQNQLSDKINLVSNIDNEIEKIVQSIVGDITQQKFKYFIRKSWNQGKILFNVDKCHHSTLKLINTLNNDKQFQTDFFYLSHQLPSTSTLLYIKEFAARLVHDSPDKKCKDIKSFSEYNIEPHYHEVDSIIIATSKCKLKSAEFMIHDCRLGLNVIIKIPFDFASVVCFPSFVSHTFMPSDIGLSTLNITDRYIQPHTNNFSHPAKYNFDDAKVISYYDYKNLL